MGSENPPRSALTLFDAPLILSRWVFSGIFRETGLSSFGICLGVQDISRKVVEHMTQLIEADVLHVSSFFKLRAAGEDVRYYLLVIPRTDNLFSTDGSYVPLSLLIQSRPLDNPSLLASILPQVLALTDACHRLHVTHGAVVPSNIFVNKLTQCVRLGPPIQFASKLLRVLDCAADADAKSVFELALCTPPELFLRNRRSLASVSCEAGFYPEVDAWMCGMTFVCCFFGLGFFYSRLGGAQTDASVEMISLLFELVGPPARVGALPIDRQAEQKLIDAFSGTPVLLREGAHGRLLTPSIHKCVLGLLRYDPSTRIRVGLGLELLGASAVGHGIRLPPRLSRAGSGAPEARGVSVPPRAVHAVACPPEYVAPPLEPGPEPVPAPASASASDLGAHSADTSASQSRAGSASSNSALTEDDYAFIQVLNGRSDDLQKLLRACPARSTAKTIKAATTSHAMQTVDPSLQHRLPCPIEDAEDLRERLRQDIRACTYRRADSSSIDEILGPSLLEQLCNRDAQAGRRALEVRGPAPQYKSHGRGDKAARHSLREDRYCCGKTGPGASTASITESVSITSADTCPVSLTARALRHCPGMSADSSVYHSPTRAGAPGTAKFKDVRTAHHDKTLFDAPRCMFLHEDSQEPPLHSLRSKLAVGLLSSAATDTAAQLSQGQESAMPLPLSNTNGCVKLLCLSVSRLLSPFREAAVADVACELFYLERSDKRCYGGVAGIRIPAPLEPGLSVPVSIILDVYTASKALRLQPVTLRGRLVLSVTVGPDDPPILLTYPLDIDMHGAPPGKYWVGSDNGMASAFIDVLY